MSFEGEDDFSLRSRYSYYILSEVARGNDLAPSPQEDSELEILPKIAWRVQIGLFRLSVLQPQDLVVGIIGCEDLLSAILGRNLSR
jgi:hypothetical protein